MNNRGCGFCQTETDGLNELVGVDADCGAMGRLRASADISCYDEKCAPKLNLYLWQQKKGEFSSEIASEGIEINYCPVCGRRLGDD